jgi:hypothetical protein
MKSRNLLILAASLAAIALLLSPAAQAQVKQGPYVPRFEIGGGVGGSFYQDKTVSSSRGSAEIGFDKFVSAGIWLGHDMYDHVGGEVRYDFSMNDMKATSGSTVVNFGGVSNAIHYDVVFYGAGRDSKVRPYAFGGGGFKLYQGTGTPTAYQGLNSVVVFTDTSDLKPMVSFGGGVKFYAGKRVAMRVEFRDNLSQFPKKVITPVNDSDPGWLHNFIVLFGVGYIF